MKRRPSQSKQMSRGGNRMAALAAVALGRLDKLDAGLIARCHGLALSEVEHMIATRREREAAHGLG